MYCQYIFVPVCASPLSPTTACASSCGWPARRTGCSRPTGSPRSSAFHATTSPRSYRIWPAPDTSARSAAPAAGSAWRSRPPQFRSARWYAAWNSVNRWSSVSVATAAAALWCRLPAQGAPRGRAGSLPRGARRDLPGRVRLCTGGRAVSGRRGTTAHPCDTAKGREADRARRQNPPAGALNRSAEFRPAGVRSMRCRAQARLPDPSHGVATLRSRYEACCGVWNTVLTAGLSSGWCSGISAE